MPRWGKIKASNPQPIDVKIGWRFLGDRFVAAVDVVNDTSAPIELKPVRNGCGCTSAQPDDCHVKSGTTMPIVIIVKREELGKFSVQSLVEWDSVSVPVKMHGACRSSIDFETLTIDESNQGVVAYKINDNRWKSKTLGFGCLESGFEIADTNGQMLTIRRKNPNVYPLAIPIVVTDKNKKTLPPAFVNVGYKGVYKVVPPLVFADQDAKVRLFLIGGTQDPGQFKSATVTSGHVSKEVAVEITKSATDLTVTLDPLNLEAGEHRVAVKLGDIEFSFLLRQRQKQ